jgi:hypothetical protein
VGERGSQHRRGLLSGRGVAPGSGLTWRESGSGLPQSKGGICEGGSGGINIGGGC